MLFKPVALPQGYGMSPNLTTWGGGVIFDGAQYHMFVAAMTNRCPLAYWTSNSRVDHAVSPTIEGPYQFAGVALNTWAHNPAPIALRDGSFAIFHIGDASGPADAGHNCSDEPPSGARSEAPPSGGRTVHVSSSLHGPWTALQPNTLGPCNNPAPWIHSNGSIFIVCGGRGEGGSDVLLRSEHISGPWETVASIRLNGGPGIAHEDPFLYTDSRGRFHLLYHAYEGKNASSCTDSVVSAHAFSEDGLEWHLSPVQPYTTQLELDTGETVTLSTRERPKLFFDGDGRMTHLINGVCSAPACSPSEGPLGCVSCKDWRWDYTLVAPLDVDTWGQSSIVS